MIDLDGHIEGPVTVTRDTALWGVVTGDVTVKADVRLQLYGKVRGNLIVERRGVALVHGSVGGALINHGAHVVVSGKAGTVQDLGDLPTQIGRDAVVADRDDP
jgi:cytoskeletal protein CcmA (bactofilin family)